MSTSSSSGRHRAPRNIKPLTVLSAAVASNAGSVGRQAAVVVAASGLVLTAGLPAHGTAGAEREVQSSTTLSIERVVTAEVTVPATATVSFDRVAVEVKAAPKTAPKVVPKTAPTQVEDAPAVKAPVVEAPVVEVPVAESPVVEAPVAPVRAPVVEDAPVAPPAPVQAPPVAAPAAVAPAPVEAAPAPAPVAVAAAPAPVAVAAAPATPAAVKSAPAPSSGIAAGLVGSAYAQIGVAQDCTAMVEKALRSVGKSVGDLAPGQFYQFGDAVGSPAAGDLVITGGHVAIYVGNGQVISGGLNGMNTGLHNLSDLPGAGFVRVR
ncbi:hypothetical protein C4K88_15645 [Arthrobacter pityocampae]|uniref:NlpC/P60 domain-containing protein n=1 Tax=Arthrobacter pityocampae TaxID=547334 RepID=A0A2S5ITQ1_9MICC|nr:NlpC/P60 family protein [Arthrobacter pityocampae]PPB47907.1 hypothetical protein C4K88_15645 [Arthrobacter pityocampae]